ncbi:hypothetical protein GCM10007857_66710 [Bradyrhizobium iriomotense]|uniref:Uncharacterized protein n=1 Tax=Bradyrhizobium iriomotense TaxID=441950 RepID=A0ABQ6BCV0_9BRAD|nr:hypothetical protein GCM10007857_66710 [Bradyrhizobium iriomotense]
MKGIDLFIIVLAGLTLGGLAAAIARETFERELRWWEYLALWAASIALLCCIVRIMGVAET